MTKLPTRSKSNSPDNPASSLSIRKTPPSPAFTRVHHEFMNTAETILLTPAQASGTAGQHRLLTPEEAAGMLRIPVETLADWRRARNAQRLAVVYVGRRPRYRLEDVEAFISGARAAT